MMQIARSLDWEGGREGSQDTLVRASRAASLLLTAPMEALRASPGAVTETAIFSALSPQQHAPYRRHDAPRPRSSASSSVSAGGVVLPRVGPGRSESPRPSGDALYLPGTEVMLPPKTPRSLLSSVPITVNECVVVWQFLCDWITAQVRSYTVKPRESTSLTQYRLC